MDIFLIETRKNVSQWADEIKSFWVNYQKLIIVGVLLCNVVMYDGAVDCFDNFIFFLSLNKEWIILV